jgi:pilus assembly protein Flp/PilA
MSKIKQALMNFIRDQEGLTVVEYAIAGGLVGLGVVTAFTSLGGEVARIILLIVARLGLIT